MPAIGRAALLALGAWVLADWDVPNALEQISEVVARFELNPERMCDVMAASAYVWSRYVLPFQTDAPFSGPKLDAASKGVMNFVDCDPGEFTTMLQGTTPRGFRALRRLIDAGDYAIARYLMESDDPPPGNPVEDRSRASFARRALKLPRNGHGRIHHVHNIWLVEMTMQGVRAIVMEAMGDRTPITLLYNDAESGRLLDFPEEPNGGLHRGLLNPAAKVTLALDDFAPDYFCWWRISFVSERLRQVMNLPASCVRFVDIDDHLSSPLVRSKKYQAMLPRAIEDVLSPKYSDYHSAYRASFMPPLARRLTFRPDVTPTNDLFYDRFFTDDLLCTEAFALRVLEAGCTGMTFIDRTRAVVGEPLRRTLRGIERRVSYQDDKEVLELVEAIDRDEPAT
jgi:hypothetical protein